MVVFCTTSWQNLCWQEGAFRPANNQRGGESQNTKHLQGRATIKIGPPPPISVLPAYWNFIKFYHYLFAQV